MHTSINTAVSWGRFIVSKLKFSKHLELSGWLQSMREVSTLEGNRHDQVFHISQRRPKAEEEHLERYQPTPQRKRRCLENAQRVHQDIAKRRRTSGKFQQKSSKKKPKIGLLGFSFSPRADRGRGIVGHLFDQWRCSPPSLASRGGVMQPG